VNECNRLGNSSHPVADCSLALRLLALSGGKFRFKGMKWSVIKTAWVTFFNVALASAFVFFLFDIWTETPIVERVLIQGSQVLVAAALVMGVALEFRRSGLAWKWNVVAQVAAAVFPCAVFLQILHTVSRNGERIDGVEAVLILYGLWILAASGITWFLYWQNNRSFSQTAERR
jgi:hypothetical protein